MKKVIFSIITALGVLSCKYITFEYICDYSEQGPRFYGFPFVQETDTTWVNSMSGEIYLYGYIGNLVFWTLLIYGIVFLLNKIKVKFLQKLFKIMAYAIILWSVFATYVYFEIIDWRLELTHDDFKMNYYQSEIDCEQKIKFFIL